LSTGKTVALKLFYKETVESMKELLDLIASNHADLKDAGFAHVANVGKLYIDEPFKLDDGLYIRKATPKEADTLRILVNVIRPLTWMRRSRNPYETKLHSTETRPGSISYSTTELPESEWRYHVIEFQGNNTKLLDFIDSSVLTPSRLELGPTVIATPISSRTSFMANSLSFGRVWDEMSLTDDFLLNVSVADLNDLRTVFQKLNSFKNERVGLREAMKRFAQLDQIPKHSPMRFLGYISILESLITHAPDPKDPADSLTRQVRQKMLLIGHRSVIPINYNIFGYNADASTLWTKLYKYRSEIAHGATPYFGSHLQCLVSPAKALEFIRSATVALMRQCLEEPDLIADLRAC
jgi:hypothetical protein